MIKDIFCLCESNQNEAELLALDSERYLANVKEDGVRCLAIKKGTDVFLVGRGNTIYKNFREVVETLSKIEGDFIIDGEVISVENDFGKLQSRVLTKDKNKILALEKTIPIKFMVFDILELNGNSLMRLPLRERLVNLENLLFKQQNSYLELCKYAGVKEMLEFVKSKTYEGVVVKDLNSQYESKRSKAWIKYKLFHETTLTITAFTENPKGIRATADDGTAVQIAGLQSNEVKYKILQEGFATINIQYLTKSKDGKFRFPSYRSLA